MLIPQIIFLCFLHLRSVATINQTIFKDFLHSTAYKYDYGILIYFSCSKSGSVSFVRQFINLPYLISVINTNTFEVPYLRDNTYTTYILDLNCLESRVILVKADILNLFKSPYKWIIHSNNLVLEEYFDPIDILVDSDVTIFDSQTSYTYDIFKIYKRQSDLPIVVEKLGNWTSEDGLNIAQLDSSVTRRKNLNQIVINTTIVVTNNDTLQHLYDKRNRHIDSITKVNMPYLLHISDYLNITLSVSVASTWGYLNNESQWSGMLGDMTTGTTEIGGTPLFPTVGRVAFLDFVAMTSSTGSKFIFRAPKLSYVSDVYTLPFSTYVWLSTAALVILTSLTLYVVVKWEWHKKSKCWVQYRAQNDSQELKDSFGDVCFMSFGAVCQQGSSVIPFSFSGQIISIVLFVSLMFLYTSYSANIVALLQSSSDNIKTLNDLLHSRLDIGVDDTVYNRFYFPNATEPVRYALYHQKIAPPGQKPKFCPTEEGIKRLREGLYAFHVELGVGYKFVAETFKEDEKCGLREISFLQVPDPWFSMRKNSSYKEMVKLVLRRIWETGIQHREVSLIYSKKPICSSKGSSFISVGIVDCYSAAVVLATGIATSTLILILEILHVKYRNRCRLGVEKLK